MTKEKKNIIWNILGATFNAFNSLFFTIVVTRLNGLNDSGIFTYSFATACVLFNIGIYQGRAFQVTDITGKSTDTDYIYHRIITCVIMMIASLAFVFIKGYDFYKSAIFLLLCLFRCIEAFVESIYAVIQKNGNLYQVGISLFTKAIIGIICFTLVNLITKNLIYACISLIIINIIVILFYDVKKIRQVELKKSKFSFKANNKIFKAGFFTFILTFLSVYLINVPRYAIDDLLVNELQTIFGIIIMPATFMGLLGQYIIQPALTSISTCIKENKYKELKKIITKLLSIILVLGVLVFIVAYLLEEPVLGFIYGVDLKPYFVSMMIIIFGSFFYATSTILSIILIAMRTTFVQAITYAIVSVIVSFLSYFMVEKYQMMGASLTYTITMILVTIVFLGLTIIEMIKYKKIWNN